MPRKVSLAQFSWDATPERLAKAANDNEIVHDKEENGAPVSRRRVMDWPLARLRSRGLLDADRALNEILFEAGELYYAAWYYAGLAPLCAIDYGREHVDGGALQGLNVSEYRLAALERFRRAGRAMGDCAPIVDAVVLNGATVSDESGEGGAAKARGMASLREGLRRLAQRYGMIEADRAAA
ncbi:hypothetical protein [Hansschlegelia beijingensis]|uniref:Uncharacterized protein n=1 Tax=Hansschlegelia beijingensis TaxID=1133344 RepID=A0A7W6D287_9HYPH|nr:hypothetical protein [Hansschlegelia beijingensis]MBB3972762.1 hypothetical protein [Hansschlegelia beijingensis]